MLHGRVALSERRILRGFPPVTLFSGQGSYNIDRFIDPVRCARGEPVSGPCVSLGKERRRGGRRAMC